MAQDEINDLKEEITYHKDVANKAIKIIQDFLNSEPHLTPTQFRKLIELKKLLAEATI